MMLAGGNPMATLIGTAGNDTINADLEANGADDSVSGLGGDDSLTGHPGFDTFDGGPGNDTLKGGFEANVLLGGAGDDLLFLTGGQDGRGPGGFGPRRETFDGNAGVDTLSLARFDYTTFELHQGTQTAVYAIDWHSADLATGIVGFSATLQFSTGGAPISPRVFETGAIVTFPELGLSSIENLVGTDLTDLLGGDEGANVLSGRFGADSLRGSGGGDTLDGGGDADTLDGGDGFDIASYASASGPVVASLLDAGGNTGDAAGDVYLLIEGLAGSAFGDRLVGDNEANLLLGLAGADTLYGIGSAADTMDGGDGADVIYVSGDGSIVRDTGTDAGRDMVVAALDFTLPAGLEDLVLDGIVFLGTGNAVGNNISGNAAANLLVGLGGNDTLTGAGGNDVMMGGSGWDFYFVDSTDDLVIEDADGEGTVFASASFSLGAAIRNLTLLGAGALAGSGNAANNLILGNSGSNWLAGGGGNDSINGGSGGQDTLRGEDGNDELSATGGGDSLDGGDGNDLLTTFGGAATLDGGAGNDTVIALEGAARVFGGAGNDQVSGGSADDAVQGGTGNDILFGDAGRDSLAGEGGTDSLIGGAGGDSLDGGADADTLEGGAEADTLAGGAGDDVYVVTDALDVLLRDTAGADTVIATASVRVGAGIEEVQLLGGGAIDGTGWHDANRILGNDAANRLSGLGGDDRLEGRGGADNLLGNDGADSLFGGDGMDALAGGAGNDWLEGGAQLDLLRGEAGADSFVLSLPPSSAEADRIMDFDRAQGDRILLAGFGLPPGPVVSLLANLTGKAAGAGDRLIYETDAGRLWFDPDGNGAAAGTVVATLAGAPTLLASDLHLI
jgi:Ca2+-binding RTX toxin-like protein